MFFACNQGFQLSFANGLTASVMFGDRNYCSNRRNPDCTQDGITSSDTAELAVWRTGTRNNLFCDGVLGYDEETGENIGPRADCGWKTSKQITAALSLVASFPGDITPVSAVEQINACFAQNQD